MKAFSVFICDLNDGLTHAGLTADLQDLLQVVQRTGRSGSLTLKIKVAPTSRPGMEVDKITITADRKLELPKPESPQDFFWLTDDAVPTRQHPRQHALDLREASNRPAAAPATHAEFSVPDPETGEITPMSLKEVK